MENLQVINEELDNDIQTGILSLERIYEFIIEENPNTEDIELSIMWGGGIFGVYLYNTIYEANIDIQILDKMSFKITEE